VTETGAGGTPERGRRRRVPVWLAYTVLRLLFFAVPLVVVYLVGGNIVIAALAAAVIGVCLSVILLHRQRAEVAAELEAWRAGRMANRREPTDEDAEDDVAGDQNANAAASPKP
jgi:hypothetical protein